MPAAQQLPPSRPGAQSDRTSAVHAVADAEQVQELMGWYAEPLLSRRLGLHIVEGVAEVAALCSCMIMVYQYMPVPALFIRLLIMPVLVVTLKLLWGLRLALAHWSLMCAKDFGTAIRRLGRVHTRDFWTLSAGFFICFSCLLMMWYGILLLLLMSYQSADEEVGVVRYLTLVMAVLAWTNWAFWRDFVNNCDVLEEETRPDRRTLSGLYLMYRRKQIRIVRFGELDATGEAVTVDSSTCIICLEHFAAEEDVAQLPCGHIFHPACVHKWIREDWRCPYRCSLEEPPAETAAAATPSGAAAVHAAPPEAAAAAVEAVDLEAGHILGAMQT
eukprot:CAMPEP_0117524724 /NCGR_PEP_ID=MMETSP0784-20121206/35397_1 /TAXON_ID=39447 /ORGANISM="" /LENGTH=329 /DNA_ID=CAMNT_0005320889 /DNA_START=15 /DNA_END=1004 /DNA_ORIENTATION=-